MVDKLSNENGSITNNMVWSVTERVTSQILSTIVSVILARLLYPEAYATVALVTVFINLATVVMSSSFSSALIYDKEQSIEHYSTAFYSILLVTGTLYLMLYITAPFLAIYYNDDSLANIIRVMSLVLVPQGIYSILFAYVSKNMLFKKTYKPTFLGAVSGASVALLLALKGHGVWALVFLPLIESSVSSFVLWRVLNFKIAVNFDVQYVKFMIRYCVKFVMVDFLNAIYSSLNSLIIAQRFSKADLSYYTKAYNLPQMLLGSVNVAISKVLFPFFSQSKEDIGQIRQKLRMGIQLSNYVLMPMMIGLMVISEEVVTLLFTNKWIGMVPYLQIMCAVWMLQPIQICTIQAYKAIGRGDEYLRLELYKKILAICVLILLLCIIQKPIIVAFGALTGQIVSCVINMPYLNQLFHYTVKAQIRDLVTPMGLCIIMAIGVMVVGSLIGNVILKMFVQIIIGIVIYISASWLLKNQSFILLLNVILKNRRISVKE